MYIHFEDWSVFRFKLTNSGLPYGDNILKVFATQENPRGEKYFNRPMIAVFKSDDSPFGDDEVFQYQNREEYSGKNLEEKIAEMGLTEDATKRVRALFRFANREDTQFTQTAMQLRDNEGNWLISHPFEDIDGYKYALRNPERLHLDVFVPKSLDKVAKLLRVESLKDAEGIVRYDERRNFDREIRRTKE